jgi:bla regulator protein BlaR1
MLIAVLFAASYSLSAQPAARPSFEVASIKPSPANCSPGPASNAGPSPGRLELPCATVRSLIRVAYGALKGEQFAARPMQVLGGPAWLDSDRYSISAKAEGRPSAAVMMGPMLQSLLEDRFQLKVHVEAKESPVYALTVAKATPKLTPAKEGACVPLDLNNRDQWGIGGPTPCGFPRMSGRDGLTTLEVSGTTMEEFAGRLPIFPDPRPVVDRTGLTGRYDIRLSFVRELPGGVIQLNGVNQPAPPPADSAGPSIFTALQEQLGLKLSPDKAPVDVLVIDSVQKPLEN